jgi:hypothetical protein
MDTLEDLLNEHGFRGRARRVRCFAHTLNLTAKATLRQFEKTKGKKNKRPDNDVSETPEFDDLPLLEPINIDAESDNDWSEMEMPDLEDLSEMIDEDDDGEKEARDEEEIVNVFRTLTVEEQERWKEQVKPLRSALFKVCR